MIPGHEIFPRAPIEEAVIDIRVSRPLGAMPTLLDSFIDVVKADYPQRARRIQLDGELSVTPDGRQQIRTGQRDVGWLL